MNAPIPGPLDLLAERLAADHVAEVGAPAHGSDLIAQLAENRQTLYSTYRSTLKAVEDGRWISPAGEWLIDNFHIIREQLREGRDDLPRGFYRELPRLTSGEMIGFPRAFAIAKSLIEHTDGQLDIAMLDRFLTAYQRVTPLTIGELWAIPISLRHAFLDRLAEIAVRVERARRERESAERLATELQANVGHGAEHLQEVLRARVSGRAEPSTTMFVAELVLRLRDRDPELALGVEWLERRIREQGTTIEDATRDEHKSQAANQVSVGNVITSMRTITATDWGKVFERVSIVERALERDPSGHYSRCDFATRDHYRHAVERIAKRSERTELEVAKLAIEHAAQAEAEREKHVGFWLVDRGVSAIEERCGYRPKLKERIGRVMLARATLFYVGGIALLSLSIAALFGLLARSGGAPPWAAVLLAMFALLPASEVAVSLVNLASARLRAPQLLPKLDFLEGIPPEWRTFVVVPTMLTSARGVTELLEALEVRYLANEDPQLHFALVTDLADAGEEELLEDRALIAQAERGIQRLNQLHGANRFFLFHRKRTWNDREQRFMGWERKRGKLVELNRLLMGAEDTSFEVITGDVRLLRDAKLIITLDSDTRLPRDTALKLVATMAHPLVRPVVDPMKRVVVDGHAILQPRISVRLESAQSSRFSRIFTDALGIDPYTSAVSDVYQDLFDRGSFVGKGIYEPRVFEQVMDGRVPADALLSHDLFEGEHLRSALLTDVELFDDVPAHYVSHAVRRHRWTRGDWQMVPWLFGQVPEGSGRGRNPLPAISRWKIFDNLRRSLVAPSTLLLLIAGWMATSRFAVWSLSILGLIAFPVFAHWLNALMRAPFFHSYRGALKSYAMRVAKETVINAVRSGLGLLFLPEQAWSNVDAIARVHYRRWISKRGLLEWTTAAEAEAQRSQGPRAVYRTMVAPLAAVSVAAAASTVHPGAVVMMLAAWWASPFAAWWLSQPVSRKERDPTGVERYFLRRAARKTWAYFDDLLRGEDHFLPPDNFQEEPLPLVAQRTSPTNMGLALMANFSALDLGYISFTTCLERLEKTLDAMSKLEQFRGHFLNWYDTATLKPLYPRYVSMVDSGNLAAYLLTVQQGCLHLGERPLFGPDPFRGFVDTLRVADDEIERAASKLDERSLAQLRRNSAAVMALFDVVPDKLGAMLERTQTIHEAAKLLCATAKTTGIEQLIYWTASLEHALALRIKETLQLCERSGAPAENVATLTLARANSSELASALLDRAKVIAARAEAMWKGMDFQFLFHRERKVFSIGYDVDGSRLDNSYYDLLASEARVGSFVAILKGDAPVSHWFRLGRPLVQVGTETALLSWTGTMFEYLMPCLLFRSYEGTLVDRTLTTVVKHQIAYGRERRVPWGVSESAYNARDLNLNYQYGPFGVPGVGLRRGLGDDLVVSPYSTMLALAIDPHAAVENLWALSAEGLEGRYGFYESIDYTPGRVPEGQRGAIIQAFMAHHQGMSLISISEHLHGRPLSALFHADPGVQATELLLQERVPNEVEIEEPPEQQAQTGRVPEATAREPWATLDPGAPPAVHLLSNGNYSVMVTRAGGGYSTCRGAAITRWREDPTRDAYGSFIYVSEPKTGRAWSATHQPLGDERAAGETCFSIDKAEFRREVEGLEVHLVITVSTEDDAEIRAVTLCNREKEARIFDVTSYAELVLQPQAADVAHPAFGNLFVETEAVAGSGALLATRRRRSARDTERWAVHVSCLGEDPRGSVEVAPFEYETARERFLGRGRSAKNPAAIDPGSKLSGTVGSVLDPIFSLRRTVRLEPNRPVRILFTTAAAGSRDAALAIASKYSTSRGVERASRLAWTHAQAQLHYLDVDKKDVNTFLSLASRMVYSNRDLRISPSVIAQNNRGQSGLWAYGISGDMPILLLRVDSEAHIDLVRQALRAHELWRLRGLAVDLVILNEHPPSYLQAFNDQLLAIVRSSPASSLMDKPGGIFVRRTDVMPAEDRVLILSAARAVLVGGRGTIEDQIERIQGRSAPEVTPLRALRAVPEAAVERTTIKKATIEKAAQRPRALAGRGPLGGFTEDGREYVIHLGAGARTPAPWANVIANRNFGALVTESGGGYVWAENSQANRLTEWSNDSVSDPPSSAIYVRDEESGAFWSPALLPAGGSGEHVVRHGQGYSVFSAETGGIAQELLIFVAAEDPVQISKLRLENRSGVARKLSITSVVEWTLGVARASALPHVHTTVDEATGAVFARNTFPGELGSRIAFCDSVPRFSAHSGDRAEVLGCNGDRAAPAAMRRQGLSGRTGAGFDPCTALQVELDLAPGETREVVFVLGQTRGVSDARALVEKYRADRAPQLEYQKVVDLWDRMLGTIEIETPDRELDLLVNRWLLYQVLSCRVYGRTGFYQSGGAYGFRDQLQDVSALLYARPDLAREHILRAASRQFREGDVQHWWHPPAGKGVRTRFADDPLWLVLITAQYLSVTGDRAILEEQVPFVEARLLEPAEHEAYLEPTVSEDTTSLYEHCLLAVERTLNTGPHGLPLMGGGDWNDGMNRVGVGGTGESVWMAWFLITTLKELIPIVEARGDNQRADRYRRHVEETTRAIEEHAWDGAWYLRAFFDDGTPLGSSKNDECRIDSLSQSWSAISGAGDPQRVRRALRSADEHLVDRTAMVAKLLAPPFDKTELDPGYIKGYVPGVRENGGQYTHAAAWLVLAHTRLGDGDRAGELLQLINPVRHTMNDELLATYRVEPYVLAGDVAGAPPHVGRGGWTWYTGSASWFYRVVIEALLGLSVRGETMTIEPCIPRAWAGFKLTYRRGKTIYRVEVKNPAGVCRGVAQRILDGRALPDREIRLADDGGEHRVQIVLGE